MYRTAVIFAIILKITFVCGDSYSVKIGTEHHVNVIDTRFLSFTIDPKYLFSTSGKYGSKECICMASSLTPAYIRIAGPSTGAMSYHNSSITIEEAVPSRSTVDPTPSRFSIEEMAPWRSKDEEVASKRSKFQAFFSENLVRIDDALRQDRRDGTRRYRPRSDPEVIRPRTEESRFKRNSALSVSHSEWRQFVHWARRTGFDLVFALNNEDKTGSGMWDPNSALNILTVAEKAKVGEIYWQLGYECTNQSIEEYLNDLETLRVITETFPPGRAGGWKVVGGDVTSCLHQDSKSDFKDYVTLSSDMMDAVLLNGNSSSVELERMSERDRLKLLKLLSHSSTPLWLTETTWMDGPLTEMSRAADWLTSLGHAARNGFSVYFRELDEEEMHQPSLSFYMALLFKNLVGEKVLDVEMEPEQAIVFAHCTSLRRKEVPGAVTLYGVNMDDEPARFSIKLPKRTEAGDVLQFVLGHDKSGNIVVNGRAMYHEGDLKPVVKRVRPYKTLLINLPPKSIGFWVLANTKIEACLSDEEYNDTENIDPAIDDSKVKRSIQDFEEYTKSDDISVDFCDENDVTDELRSGDLSNRVVDIDEKLIKVKALFKNKPNEARMKRQVKSENQAKKRMFMRQGLKNRNMKSETESKPRRLLGNLLQHTKHNISRFLKTDRLRLLPRFHRNKLSKRQSDIKPKKIQKKRKVKLVSREKNIHNKDKIKAKVTEIEDNSQDISKIEEDAKDKVRTRRHTDQVELSAENDIDIDGKDNAQLWKMLRKIHKQFKDLSEEEEYVDTTDENVNTKEHKHNNNEIDVDDDTNMIKSTLFNLLRVVSDLNRNLDRVWNGMRIFD